MKINRVECEQFAGILNREVELKEGMNLLIGENESGKSTLIDLIYHLLFRPVKLHLKNDAEFIENYFPKKAGGPQGDVIDGVLRFETEKGSYKLTKEWERGQGVCKLALPDGTLIKSPEEIQRILSEELGYGEGVFGELVFASQKRQLYMLESIMKELTRKKEDKIGITKADMLSAVNRATLETGGVSITKLEEQLTDKLERYGERWDFDADLPEQGVKRGIENKWNCAMTKEAEAGRQAIILHSYYVMNQVLHGLRCSDQWR